MDVTDVFTNYYSVVKGNSWNYCASPNTQLLLKVLSIFLVDLLNVWGLGLRVCWMGSHMGPFHHANTAYKFQGMFVWLMSRWPDADLRRMCAWFLLTHCCFVSPVKTIRLANADSHLHSAHFVFCGKEAVFSKNNAAFVALCTRPAVYLSVMFQHELRRCESSTGTSGFPPTTRMQLVFTGPMWTL